VSFDQPSVLGRLLRSSLSGAIAALLIVLALVAPAAAVSGPTKLSDPAVAPRAAVPGQPIVFSVTYRNREGSPPDAVRVSIGGSVHAMAPAPGDEAWKQGVRFTFSTSLPVGSHSVVFSATDREKFSDEIDGGTATVAPPPAPDPTPAPNPPPTPAPAPTPTSNPTNSNPTTSSPSEGPGTPTARTDGSPSGSSPTDGSPVDPAADRDLDWLAPARPGPGSADPDSPGAEGPDGAGGAPDGGALGAPGAPGARGVPGVGGGFDSDRPGDPTGPADPSAGNGPTVSTSGGWGDLARALESLGIDAGRSQLMPVLPTVVGTAGGVTMLMAFMFFGKKRRDGEPPAPDEVLHAKAARGTDLPRAGELMPHAASTGPGAGPRPLQDAELTMPRWRRPSLLEARKKDPLRDTAAPPPSLSFEHGLVGPLEGRERRIIRYHVVRLLDAPDELRSAEIGFLDQGDEVQLLERSGTYWLVLCPDGRRGWLHKMTLGDVVGESPAPGPRETWATSGSDHEPAVDDDVLAAFLAARGRA
jgi:hypothetical protein